MQQPLVQLQKVSVKAGSTPILTGIDLEVGPGEVVGIAGPNGAGKTTLLGVIATLTAPSAGNGSVLGARLGTSEIMGIRPRIGWSGHEPGLYPELTLAENLRFSARIMGIDLDVADRSLAVVGLEGAAERRADRASNGMRRRVDLARLLMAGPDLVLLDEAQAGLDASAEVIIDEILRQVRERSGGAVLVSHDARRLSERVDRMCTISAGELR